MDKCLRFANLLIILSMLLVACAPAAVPAAAPQEAPASDSASTGPAKPADMAANQELTMGRVFYFSGHFTEGSWYDGGLVMGGGLLETTS